MKKVAATGNVIMHDGMTFPNAFLFMLDEPKPITHKISGDGIAAMPFYNDFYIGQDEQSTNKYADYIAGLKDDSQTKGLIIEMYSGGGVDVAGELLRAAVAEFADKKPVIIHAQTIGSAAYLAASAANLIIATNGLSRIGSIGAYISLPRYLAEFYKEYFQDVYAEQSGDKNGAWRKYLEDYNTEEYQAMANRSAQYFITAIKQHREIKDEALTGKMFEAKAAKAMGLIDGIGGADYVKGRMAYLMRQY